MTTTAAVDSFSDSSGNISKPIGVYGTSAGLATALSAAMLAVSAVFAIGDDTRDFLVLATTAALCGVVGASLLRRPFSTSALRPVPTMSAAVCGFLLIAAISTIVYLATGAISRIDDALYESVAGVSTSALTLFDDPSVLGDGVLVWRSATQWLGGIGAIALAVGLLPFIGGSRELAGGPQRRARTRDALATRPLPAVRRVGTIYCVVTAVVTLALLMAGMDVLDAIAHALSTVSTGGFSTHADSIAHFDSVAIETVLVVAMLGAGSSVAFAWLLWRRNISETRRAFELQVYLVVVAAASLWIWWLRNDNDISASRGFREAFFTVVSVMTTTGHRISDWGSWHPGAATLLLLLVVVGGTAGSVAGGLRWIRVIGMAQFVWRELQRQLHPRSVRTVKVGRSTISEASVDRMHAQMLYVMTVGAVASLVLGLFGEGLTEAITLTLSAISTMGPGFDEAGGIVTAADLTSPERAVLMPVMLTGRVFLYPAFIAVGAGASAISTAMRSTGVRQ
ncbi:MAG: trk system potassium uptake protein TrkH [Thermoproteota archaeon]